MLRTGRKKTRSEQPSHYIGSDMRAFGGQKTLSSSCWYLFLCSSIFSFHSCCWCLCWTITSNPTGASVFRGQGRRIATSGTYFFSSPAGRRTRSRVSYRAPQLPVLLAKDDERTKDEDPATAQPQPREERIDLEDGLDAGEDDASGMVHQALRQRLAALEEGIGKRYVCRTQIGFLNVHEEPDDPFRTDNVVGRLVDGDIVASTGPPRGDWIQHDGGGWSIAVHGGFVWLQELKE